MLPQTVASENSQTSSLFAHFAMLMIHFEMDKATIVAHPSTHNNS